MKALCVSTGRTVAPFGDPVSQAQVGAGSLAEAQVAALFAAGFEPVRAAPVDEPYLVYSDRTWFTPALLEAVRRAGPGRVRIADPRWWAWTGALQDVPEPGLYELGIRTGPPGFADLEPVDLQLELHELELDALHPAVAHGHSDPLFVGPAMAHQLDHWTHIGRINQLVLVARMEAAKLEWEEAGFFRRLFKVLGILLKARSFSGAKIAASLNERAKNVEIHPSAVVELCAGRGRQDRPSCGGTRQYSGAGGYGGSLRDGQCERARRRGSGWALCLSEPVHSLPGSDGL